MAGGRSVTYGGVLIRQSELRVLKLLVDGKSNKQIADELGIAINSVARILTQVSRKLKARNRVTVAVWAVRNGIS